MRNKKDKLDLELERPGYPWQVVEGDGVTWLILRQKKRFERKEIKSLAGVFLDGFSWSVKETTGDLHLYSGSAAFSVNYMVVDMGSENMEFVEEGEDEEFCRDLFVSNIKKSEEQGLSDQGNAGNTAYPSLLFDEVKPDRRKKNDSGADNCWKVEIPWRVWLMGSGMDKEPRIIKIHLAQVGLSSLLLEVLIKLETDNNMTGSQLYSKKYRLSYRGETTYSIKDDYIQEIIGAAQQRGFYTSFVDSEDRSLLVKNILKTSIVFISAIAGGERILTASGVTSEENKFTGLSLLQFPPVGYYQHTQLLKVFPVDAKRMLCRYEHLWGIKDEINEEEDNIASKNLLKDYVVAIPEQYKKPSIIERRKPGEKWMKKQNSPKSERPEKKLVLTIKKVEVSRKK